MMARRLVFISFLIVQVTSQVLWINQDTGQVLGISPSGSKEPPEFTQQQSETYRQPPGWSNPHHGNPNWKRPNQHQGHTVNNINAEWVCRNTRTGDQMIIASDVGQTQRPHPNQDTHLDNSYQHNPWLNKPQQPNFNNENRPNFQTEKSTFPTLEKIDWTKYLEASTTKKPNTIDLNSAITGEGVIQPRVGD